MFTHLMTIYCEPTLCRPCDRQEQRGEAGGQSSGRVIGVSGCVGGECGVTRLWGALEAVERT